MHPDYNPDQAEGLRRLLLRDSARMIMVTAARTGFGITSMVVNLATALSQAGKNVLILDENPPQNNSINMLGLSQHYDLLDAVRYRKTLNEIVLHSRQGVHILPIARTIRLLPQLSMAERSYLMDCLAEVSNSAEIVLVDTTPCIGAGKISISSNPSQPLLLVLNATHAAITESYALIKRLSIHDSRMSFAVAVNKARDEKEARIIFDNMEQVASHHLQVQVEYLGYIPADEKLKRATQLRRPVAEIFPKAPATSAFNEIGRNLMLLSDAGIRNAASLPDMVQQLLARRLGSPGIALATY